MRNSLCKADNNDCIIAKNVRFAVSFADRTRGMIGRRFAKVPFDAMVFENCNAVHCCWMSEAIDVIYVNDKLEVVKLYSDLKPWRFASGGRSSCAAIELPAGKIRCCGLKTGDRLIWKDLTGERI